MLSAVLAALGLITVAAGLLLRIGGVPSELPPVPPEMRSDPTWMTVDQLRLTQPEASSSTTLTRRQRMGLIVGMLGFSLLLLVSWNLTLVVLIGSVIVFYFAAVALRLVLFVRSLNGAGSVRIPDDIARAAPESVLPSYTLLIPAYDEPEVVSRLVANLDALEYPRGKLEVLLLLESDDRPTIEAAEQAIAAAGDSFRIVLIPQIGPRTKPKALNYGLHHSTGELVTIFDAEDRPDPLQLRKAALALKAAPDDVACIQARLDFFNPTQNLITKWFTLDYRMWFTQFLPGLVQLGAPIPLGGTSNHFRRSTLMEVGAWDAHNVTEDADLGIRLYRHGYRTGVLDSVTLEEANSDFVNWVKQRSRWYKGYVQTSLVHLRHPRTLLRDLGLRAFLLFLLFVAGTPLLAALNPAFWLATAIWFTLQPHVMLLLIPTFTYFVGQTAWIAGNGVILYSWLLSTRRLEERLWTAALTAPAYWAMMSLAAGKAVIQLVTAPTYWEKTTHGLDTESETGGVSAMVAP